MDFWAATKDRSPHDDPPLPPELLRGAPGALIAAQAVQPVVVLPDSTPQPAEQVAALALGELDDLGSGAQEVADDPALQWMRDWRPKR